MPANHLEVFAIIGEMLFSHRVSAAVVALVGNSRIVINAIEAHLQIGTARMTRFKPPRLTGKRVIFAAFPAMTR